MFKLYHSLPTEQIPQEVLKQGHISLSPLGAAEDLPSRVSERHFFFFDWEFLSEYGEALGEYPFLDHSILVYNPRYRKITFPFDPDKLYQEIFTLSRPEHLHRVLVNGFRTLSLTLLSEEREREFLEQEGVTEELLSVGTALSAEKNNDRLLDYILKITRNITRADAGSLYLVKPEENQLLFKIAHNDSIDFDFKEIALPLSKTSIAGYVALTGKPLNIVDAYEIPESEEYSFNKSFDSSAGYRTKSMLTVPMEDNEGKVIGVIQLLNRKKNFSDHLEGPQDSIEQVIPFSYANIKVVTSLASQAAVSLVNNRLLNEIEELFEGFVKASVKAIESRDPTTSGHSQRVANFTVGLAKKVDNIDHGRFKNLTFTHEQITEIRYASLLHDFGKVGVRENVLVKAEKLYPHQMRQIAARFAFIRNDYQLKFHQEVSRIYKDCPPEEQKDKIALLQQQLNQDIAKINEAFNVIKEANRPTVLAESPARVLDQIEQWVHVHSTGYKQTFLTKKELDMLKIPRGSLNEKERLEIESHVQHTYEFLKQIPWTGAMKNIPDIARWHHEKLDGSGYPDQLSPDNIPIQSRMMTVSDIYDALTARDRPYKRAVPRNTALDILNFEVKDGKLDPLLVDIFITSKIYDIT